MAVYLIDHPPRTQQYRCPRRRNPSGIIGVHTAESFADEDGHDSSAEGVAAFIRSRTNYGSYHLIVDSDSIIQLVEFGCVAYHIGTHSLNEHTIGISAATQAAKWNSLSDDYEDKVLRNMARAAARAARWLQREHGITVPARRISLAQALNGERGFLAHGDADPERRTDPGSQFKWARFLSYYAAEMAGELEDDMPQTVKAPNGEQWDTDHALSWMMNRLNELRWGPIVTAPNDEDWTTTHALGWLMRRDVDTRDQLVRVLANQRAIMQSQGVEVDEAALGQQIAATLVPAVIAALPDTGLTAEQVEEATEAAVRNVLGSLDDA